MKKKKPSTIKNKFWAAIFIAIGVLSIFIENDATAFVFVLIFVVPLLLAKENIIG